MNAVAQACALIQALIYVSVAPLECLFLRRPAVQRFLSTPAPTSPR